MVFSFTNPTMLELLLMIGVVIAAPLVLMAILSRGAGGAERSGEFGTGSTGVRPCRDWACRAENPVDANFCRRCGKSLG